MKIFPTTDKASKSLAAKPKLFLNAKCPFNKDSFCGNWCSLFYAEREGSRIKYVLLGCKGTDKKLYIG